MAVWVPVYSIQHGPANFLWLCDVANFVITAAVWLESPLLFSSQAVGVLVIQVVWAADFIGRVALGFHPVGGTEYMFDPTRSLALRSLSLFHLVVPFLLVWATRRLGYDRRGWRLQTLLTWLVLPLSFVAAAPKANLNWLWAPFGIEQTLMAPAAYLGLSMILYPLALYLPTHLLLSRWVRRNGWHLLPVADETS